MTTQPFVLLVDDDPAQEAFALLLSQQGVEAKHVLPGDLLVDDLDRASLVLIDEFIEDWPARDLAKDELGLFVRDGIALASVLRSALDGRGPSPDTEPKPKNTAFVLRTGHLDVLGAGTPAFIRPMAIASRHDLEWAAEKTRMTAKALASLAIATSKLPTDWSNPVDPVAQLAWLDLPQAHWRDDAIAQIELCRPPWSVLAATSAGRRWLSWFLQRILPFPTFLVDDRRAASYLGLKPSALDDIVGGENQVAEMLSGAEYRGQLADFSGRRWWRAGISAVRGLALESSDGRMSEDVARSIALLHGKELETLGLQRPVFQIDDNYNLVDEPLEITDAVRLQPDDWPSYADDPWLATASIDIEQSLAKLVVIDDRNSGADKNDE
ncbi:MAG: hypothetical protein IIZ13_16505 [Renibacterium sp.]|nr:hypothetical protein [Renibacterium sp.]